MENIGTGPKIYVGSYIQTEKDVWELGKLGIKAVLNLQTDEDLQKRNVDLNKIEVRAPIREKWESEGETGEILGRKVGLLAREKGRRDSHKERRILSPRLCYDGMCLGVLLEKWY